MIQGKTCQIAKEIGTEKEFEEDNVTIIWIN